jgi:hypothetical protein
MKIYKTSLLLAGISSLLIALFQAIISFSVEWSRFFDAPVVLLSKPILLLISGSIAALIFAIFGLYGLSGAGQIKRLPYLRSGLTIVGIIYSLRGLAFILILLQTYGVITTHEPLPPAEPGSSLISLGVGLLYLFGTTGLWSSLTEAQQ